AIVAVAALSLPVRVTAENTFPVDAVGRLVLNGRHVCTAFTIRSEQVPSLPRSEAPTYRNWLVTAGHCVDQLMPRGQLSYIANSHGGVIRYPAEAYHVVTVGYSSAGWGLDVAVLGYWTSHPVATLEPMFNYPLGVGDWLLTAGFPRGVLSFSVGRYQGTNEAQQLLVDARLSRGSSGGPVLILGTRKAIGIIVEGTIKPTLNDAAPGACVFTECPLDRPYRAVPIDWILRVIPW
ncbi:MAG TPA: serine protease, partial [Anaerolineales bacterium]